MTTEQTPASPLDALAASAETTMTTPVDGSQDGSDGTEVAEVTQILSNEEILTGAITAGRDVFCMYTKLQSPAHTLDATAIGALVKPWCLVLQKRGIELGKYMGDFGLELAAIMATIGVGRVVVAGIQSELKATSKPTIDAADSRDPAAVE